MPLLDGPALNETPSITGMANFLILIDNLLQ